MVIRNKKRFLLPLVLLVFCLGVISCSTSTPDWAAQKTDRNAHLAESDAQYRALNLKKVPEPWEDGRRTDGGPGSYEWWYTDAELENGMTVVAGFYSKGMGDLSQPGAPFVMLDITFPDGRRVNHFDRESKGNVIQASKTDCDVVIKNSYLKRVDGRYLLHVEMEEAGIIYDVQMVPTLPMWRPASGHWYFGDHQEDFFAWFPAVPSATVEGALTIDGKTTVLKGNGYHDHNWGNIEMFKLMNHWYWGRAKIGAYDMIISDIVTEKAYGYSRLPVFMLAKNGKIIHLDQQSTKIERFDTITHPTTGKFMDNRLVFSQTDDKGILYQVELIRDRDISYMDLLERLPFYKRWIAKAMGANPTYLRTLGEVKLTVTKDGKSKVHHSEGLWEQMFFGSNKDAHIWN